MLGLLYLAEKGFKKAFSAKYKRIIGGMWVKNVFSANYTDWLV